MSTLPGNKDYDEACLTVNFFAHKNVEADADVIALGQLEATLALAHETRTLALIAYQANVERSYHHTLTRHRSGQANALNRQIIERLGLE